MITEMNLLSDEELDAVSGGDKAAGAENKKENDAIKGFQQMLQELP